VRSEARRRGQVVALLANYCWVVLDQPGPAGQSRLLCTRRTRLAKSGQDLCAGDWVAVDGIDWPAGRAAVAAIEPRGLTLQRPPVANITRVVVVTALCEPALDPVQLTRFLIAAEASGAAVELVLSKADLVSPVEREQWLSRIRSWGYDPVAVSAPGGMGLQQLRQRLSRGGVAVLCGPSGVGKSSLINALIPELALRVAAVSGRLQRGRHTTRHVELFALSDAALLADTPGFNRPQLPAEASGLAGCFPELRPPLAQGRCQFSDCLHQGEPGCGRGNSWDRYPIYSQCLQQIGGDTQRGADSGSLRQRGNRLEPRLAAQLRQPSRRRQRQTTRAELITPPDPED